MKFVIHALLTTLIFASSSDVLAVAAKPVTRSEFAIEIPPSEADWRYFQQMLPKSRAQLWQSATKRGKELKDWAWGWRLGWVQVCIDDPAAYCRRVVSDAMNDKALVVRAEAAKQIGRKYEGTGDSKMLEILTAAYENSRNLRRGKPMYIQQRILYAIKQIGGNQAIATGKRLAQKTPATDTYWNKLNQM